MTTIWKCVVMVASIAPLIFCEVDKSSLNKNHYWTSDAVQDQSLVYEVVPLDSSQPAHAVGDMLEHYTLIKLHGCFMVVAWMGTTTIGILIARYFKRTWINNQIFGTQAWFFWHRVCMMFTWSLTVTAFIMIFIDVDGWSQEEMPHAVLGTITTLICVTHPILATFRPNLGDAKRKYFNRGHAFGGVLAQILSMVTIFLAVNMEKAQLPSWLFFVLGAFLISLVLFHVYFTYVSYKSENHPLYPNRNFDAPYAKWRKYGLLVAALITLGFVVTLSTVIIMAPLHAEVSS